MKSIIEGLFMLAFGLSILGAILAWQIVLPVIGLLWVFGGLT